MLNATAVQQAKQTSRSEKRGINMPIVYRKQEHHGKTIDSAMTKIKLLVEPEELN